MKKEYIFFVGLVAAILIADLLVQVFSGRLILPQTIDAGFFHVHIYGICIAFAVIVAWLLAIERSKQYGVSFAQIDNLFIYILIFGFLGARLYHVISAYPYYLSYPADIFKVWNGGLAVYGAVAGGIIGLILAKRIYKLTATTYQLLDWLAPSVILGQAIGRFGNFFNYELYGYPTNLPWKMFVPAAFRSVEFFNIQFYHPLFLYESLGCAVILFILLFSAKLKFFKPAGTLFFSHVLLYNIVRFFLEPLRIDTTVWSGFRINLGISLLLVLISLVYIVKTHARKTA